MKLQFLGGFEGVIDGVSMGRLRSRKGVALLALLAMSPDQDQTRESLCATLWPDSPDDAARLSLRQSLSDLRRTLGSQESRIQAIGSQSLRWNGLGVHVDALEFERLATLPNPSSRELDEALSLYHGPFLDGFPEDAVAIVRDRLGNMLLRLFQLRADRYSEEGNEPMALELLQRAARLAPLDQRSHRSLMRKYAESGRLAEALDVYRQLVDTLQTKFDTVPDATTTGLYQSFRRQIVETHRTVSRPSEGSWITGSGRALAGRELALTELEALLQRTRFVTITGLGGIGKSVLAAEVARRMTDLRRQPSWFVSLVNSARGISLRQQMRSSLSIPDGVDLVSWLANKEGLLVIDNCELDLEPLATLIPELLAVCTKLSILCTSRVRIDLFDEVVYALPPLQVPAATDSPAVAQATPACSLLIERIRQISPTWRPRESEILAASEVCRLVEGIPLAIELAAAQARVLTLTELHRRLSQSPHLLRTDERQRPERHRSLQLVLEESYVRLDPESQRCLRQLSVFAGGFSLEAAESVVDVPDVVSCLSRLIDLSFVQVVADHDAEPRYRILEPIRQYASQLLTESGEDAAARLRHVEFTFRLTQLAIDGLMSADQTHWVERIESEYDNIRAALTHADSNEIYASIVSSLAMQWHIRWHTDEVFHWLESAMERTAGLSYLVHARLYYSMGLIRCQRLDYVGAERDFTQSLRMAIQSGGATSIGAAHSWLSNVFRLTGRTESAYTHALIGLEYYEKASNDPRTCRARNTLARAAEALCQEVEAEGLYRQSLDFFEKNGHLREVGLTDIGLASNLISQNRASEAIPHLRRALLTFSELDDILRLAHALIAVAYLADSTGQDDRAARLYGAVERMQSQYHFTVTGLYGVGQGRLDVLCQHLEGPPYKTARIEGGQLSHAAALDLALQMLCD